VIATTKIRVRYKDTDCMKVVYYGNYLTYFEVGRVEFLRQQGLAMSEVDRRIHLPVVEALVRYRKPARLDDLLEVRCWVSERRRRELPLRLRDPRRGGRAGRHRIHPARVSRPGHERDGGRAVLAPGADAGRQPVDVDGPALYTS
jgi:YbgC/YbaW family acyl-CoA thioester hydrolase